MLSLLQLPGSSNFTRSANNNVNVITADVEASTSYRRHNVPIRCYSTSPETEPKPPEGARDETQERPEKIPLKVANSLRCICAFKFVFFFLLQNRSYGLFTLPDADSDSDFKPRNGYIVLCRTFHTAWNRIHIAMPTAQYRNGNRIQSWNRNRNL